MNKYKHKFISSSLFFGTIFLIIFFAVLKVPIAKAQVECNGSNNGSTCPDPGFCATCGSNSPVGSCIGGSCTKDNYLIAEHGRKNAPGCTGPGDVTSCASYAPANSCLVSWCGMDNIIHTYVCFVVTDHNNCAYTPAPSVCGDGQCTTGESFQNCPQDCYTTCRNNSCVAIGNVNPNSIPIYGQANCNNDCQTAINGACGSSNGSVSANIPTDLCSSGGATAVTKSGSTYSWACMGQYFNHTNVGCSSSIPPPPPTPAASCLSPGTTATISWSPVLYATYYNVLAYNSSGGLVTNQSQIYGTTATFATNAGASYTYYVNTLYSGTWIQGGVNSLTCASPPAPPTCSSAAPQAVSTILTSGTFYAYAYGVSADATAVNFPTWGDVGGQDDIVWYPGTNLGGGTWRAAINMANHKAGNPEYGNINVHVYMNNAGNSNVWCGSANFNRIPPPPTNVSATCTGSGTDTLTVNWALPSGFTKAYIRAQDIASGVYVYPPTADGYQGTSISSNSGSGILPGHTYNYWVHTYENSTGVASDPVGTPWGTANGVAVTCPNANAGVTLTASPNPITSNTASTLTWTIANATSCTDNNGNMPAGNWSSGTTGSASTGNLNANKTYSLTCSNSTSNQTSSVTVGIKAHIGLNPTTLTFNASSGGSAPSGQTVNINNTGITALNWTSSGVPGKAATWCHISPASGSIAGGGNANATITVDNPSTVGSFTDCGIRIIDANADNSPQDVAITYTVSPGVVDGGVPAGTFTVSTSTCAQIDLTWTPGNGANAYNIYRNTTGVNPVAGDKIKTNLPMINNNVGNQTFNDNLAAGTGFAVGQKYYYWVESVNTGTGLLGPKVPGNTNSTGPGVTANSCVVPPVIPQNPQAYNSTSASTSCTTILLQWTDNSGTEDGFYLYRKVGSDPTPPDLSTLHGPANPSYIAASSTVSKVATGRLYSLTYTPPDTNAYYYWVTSYTNTSGFAESAPVGFAYNGGGGGSSVSSVACTANMSDSDKDIVAVNGNTAAGNDNPCNHTTDPLPSGVTLNSGDKLTFKINLCNDNGQATSTGMSVTDTMVNLVKPPGGWNAQYCVLGACNSVTPTESGTSPNQTLAFNLTSHSYDIPKAVNGHLTFDALLQTPANVSGNTARFQNSFNIGYGGGLTNPGATPLLPFLTGKRPPTIIEIP